MTKIVALNLKTRIGTLFNYPINQGIFPSNLKIALIHPIHKGKSKMLCSNYHPISILPILSKIYKKRMYKRLYEVFLKNKTFYSQFGF